MPLVAKNKAFEPPPPPPTPTPYFKALSGAGTRFSSSRFSESELQQLLLQAVNLRSEQLSMNLIESYESLVRSRQ